MLVRSKSDPSLGNVAEKKVASQETTATPKPNIYVESFITDDLTSGDISLEKQRDSLLLQHDIINFTKTPYRLEKLLFLGFWICYDIFLYVFTMFPIRAVLALWSLLKQPFSNKSLTPAQSFDLLRMTLCIICTYFLTYIDGIAIYDFIRSQSVIKLYVVFNSMEIFDKLATSLGQDLLDTLWLLLMPKKVYEQIEKVVVQENEKEVSEKTAKDAKKDEDKKKPESDAGDPLIVPSLDVSSVKPLEKSVSSPRLGSKPTPEKNEASAPIEKKEKEKDKEKEKEKAPLRKKDIQEMVSQSSLLYRCFLFFFTCGYLIVHSTFLYIKVMALNVAVNSKANAMITLLISTNFMEIKSSVFKGYKEESLFQTTLSDILERFQLLSYVVLIAVNNWTHGVWALDSSSIPQFFYVLLAIWGTEHLVDWTKHSFIAKFNKIPAFSYHKFRVVLYSDVIDARKIGSLDPIQNTARRLGFIPFPLCCLMVRMFLPLMPFNTIRGLWLVVVTYFCLFALRTLIHILLVGKCYREKSKIDMMLPTFSANLLNMNPFTKGEK
jgi:hypothetical protein